MNKDEPEANEKDRTDNPRDELRGFNYCLHRSRKRWKKEFRKPSFVIEVIAVCGLGLYTCETHRTNNLTDAILREARNNNTSTSDKTDQLIGETHALATNAGAQAKSAGDQVEQLKGMVAASSQQATALSGQLSIMRKQLEAADRPWVSAEIAAILTPGVPGPRNLIFDQDGTPHVTLEIRLKNIGRSVANNVSSTAMALALPIYEGFSNTPVDRQKQICGYPEAITMIQHSIFPGNTESDYVQVSFATKEIVERRSRFQIQKMVAVFVYGCANYQSAASAAWHQTGFPMRYTRAIPNIRGFKPEL